MLNRRTFLHRAALLGAVPPWLLRVQEAARAELAGLAPESGVAARAQRCVVVVELNGGNDGLNTIAPVEDDLYHRARPSLAITKAAGLPLDDHNRWHPSLVHVARRFTAGEVAAVQGIGYAQPNLSHFSSLDMWHSGHLRAPLPAEGWLGRAADLVLPEDASPLSLLALGRDVAPHLMRAQRLLPAAVPRLEAAALEAAPRDASMGEAAARRAALEALERGGATSPHAVRLAAGARAARQVAEELARAATFEPKVEWPASDLARDLELVARVLAHGLPTRFFFVSQGGYDTHALQATPHAALLRDLDLCLNAFLGELAARGLADRVLVVTLSEFGRRVRQNGFGDRAGTDHGAASMQLLLGAGVEPGLYGPPPDLANLDADGNLVHRVDFRTVVASIVERWLGADSEVILGERLPLHAALRA
jgi:uncharacterized protein (DUF1501 family)